MLSIGKDKVHFAFDAGLEPCAHAESGDHVEFRCQDCYSEQLATDHFDFTKIDMRRVNPATGPLFVMGAEPGDVLKVEILSIELADEGSMCVRTGSGIYEIEGCHCRRFKVEGGEVAFDRGIRIPLRPMIGVIGTAPSGAPVPTVVPGKHGGNLDIRDLGAGTVLYLPVNVAGALLSMGDLHGVQGDGESVVCAMEMSGEVRVKVSVLKGRADIPTPFLVTKTHYATIAADPSLDLCSAEAARAMHSFLQKHSALSDAQSGMLLSMLGNMRISQVVNPAKGCIMEFPIGIAGERFEP
jgi:amidase